MYSKSIATICLLAFSASALPQGRQSTNIFDVTGTSPSNNGVGNGNGKNLVDGIANNADVLKGAGIANGAANGATLLNNNNIKPNIITAGNAGNDGNGAIAVGAVTSRANDHRISHPTVVETPIASIPVGHVAHASPHGEERDGVFGNAVESLVGSNLQRGRITRRNNKIALLPQLTQGRDDRHESHPHATPIAAHPQIVRTQAVPVVPAVAPSSAISAGRVQSLSPAANGVGNGSGGNGVDGLLNNADVLKGAGIANGAVNGLTALNGNDVKPNIVNGGDAGNDANTATLASVVS